MPPRKGGGFGPGQGRLPALWQQNTLGGDLPGSNGTKTEQRQAPCGLHALGRDDCRCIYLLCKRHTMTSSNETPTGKQKCRMSCACARQSGTHAFLAKTCLEAKFGQKVWTFPLRPSQKQGLRPHNKHLSMPACTATLTAVLKRQQAFLRTGLYLCSLLVRQLIFRQVVRPSRCVRVGRMADTVRAAAAAAAAAAAGAAGAVAAAVVGIVALSNLNLVGFGVSHSFC